MLIKSNPVYTILTNHGFYRFSTGYQVIYLYVLLVVMTFNSGFSHRIIVLLCFFI